MRWPTQMSPSQMAKLIRAEKDSRKALTIFNSPASDSSHGYLHDPTAFRVMISKLVSSNHFTQAEDLLHQMKEEKCEIPEEVFLSIYRGYARVHRPMDIIRVFRKMKEFQSQPTDKSYITIIDLLVGENCLKIAMDFYKYVRRIGIPHSVVLLNVLIKALCKRGSTMGMALGIFNEMASHGCTPDSYTYGTLICGLCRSERFDEGMRLFKEMGAKGLTPTVVTYTYLINGLCVSGDLHGARELFEEMSDKGIKPNVYTYSSLINGFCRKGWSMKALGLLDLMISNRISPNMITFTTLISGLSNEGRYVQVMEIFDRMKLQGLTPDSRSYSRLINGLCDMSDFRNAADCIDEMVIDGVVPSRMTWSVHVRNYGRVVEGLSKEGDLNRAFMLYVGMRYRGITVLNSTFECLTSCFCDKRLVEKAVHILNDMIIDRCVPKISTWHVVLGRFLGRGRVEGAAEVLLLELVGSYISPCAYQSCTIHE